MIIKAIKKVLETQGIFSKLSVLCFGSIMVLFFLLIQSETQVIDDKKFEQAIVRTTSAYMPSEVFIYCDPVVTALQNKIRNGHYIVVNFRQIDYEWNANDSWFWSSSFSNNTSSGMSLLNSVTDYHVIGKTNGVMDINAELILNNFYLRSMCLQISNCYRIGFWAYVVNASVRMAIDVRDVVINNFLQI